MIEEWGYTVKVLRKPKTPLERQILEEVLIEEEKLEEIMNSKSEYGNNVIPRIRIEVGARIIRDDELEAFRRQWLEEDLEEGGEWERDDGSRLAGERYGEELDPIKAKITRVDCEIGDTTGVKEETVEVEEEKLGLVVQEEMKTRREKGRLVDTAVSPGIQILPQKY